MALGYWGFPPRIRCDMAATSRKRSPPPDYKPSPPASDRGGVPGWVWVMIGLLISMVGALGYYILGDSRHAGAGGTSQAIASSATPIAKELTKVASKPPVSKEPAAKESTSEAAPKPAPVAEGTSSTSFDFYKLLPAMKVGDASEPPQESPKPTVKEPPKPPAKEPALKQPTPPAKEAGRESAKEPSTVYVLQAGAFHTSQEADRLRAHLAFMGLESTIQTVGAGASEVWHRVRLGPFREFNQATQIQQRLRQESISATLSKERRN
ncbi:putative SPOR domain-containing protein [Gammaproteobacteria bacterium]